MDLYVPGEMLARIASFLSKKDCNSLSRTSKTAYNKLDSYRNILPKTEMNIILRWHTRYMSLTAHTSEHRWDDPSNWMVDVFSSPDEPITDAAEAQDQLLTYFKQQKISPIGEPFQMLHFNGIELSLDILFSHFHIKNTFLDGLDIENCKLMTSYMREKGWKVTRLSIRSERIPSCTMELISACRPDELSMQGDQPPEGFWQAQLIRYLLRIDLMTTNNEMSDRDLLSLTAPSLHIIQIGDVTANGLISFISEWVTQEREVILFSVRMDWLVDWREELAALKRDLVDIDITHEGAHTFEYNVFGNIVLHRSKIRAKSLLLRRKNLI